MNALNLVFPDPVWIYAAIALSFLAGCIYRLCTILGNNTPSVERSEPELKAFGERYEQEMTHVRELHEELIHVKEAFELRVADAAQIPKPMQLGIDPFKLARSGASIAQLMQRCRLSRAEAELVYSVHGAGSGRKTAMPAKSEIRSSGKAFTA